MNEAKRPRQPVKQSGSGTAAKKKNSKKNQRTQLIMMVAALVVCAVLITWTVMLLRERLAENRIMNEQSSSVQVWEQSSAEETEEPLKTAVPEFQEATVTTTSTTEYTGTTESTRPPDATAPPAVKVQDPHFVKATSVKGKQTTNSQHSASGGTTYTETQPVPENVPAGTQIPYNQLLALYLGAQAQGGHAYFMDGAGNAEPTVVLHGNSGYYVVSAADEFSVKNRLGGTGGSAEQPWQTGADFKLYQYDDNGRYLYYSSQGNNFQIIGYYNAATCENIWARLHYYQLGAGWQAEYYIHHCNRPDSMNGTESELNSGTFDTQELYGIPAEFLQILSQDMLAKGMSAGNWNGYYEITVDSQEAVLRAKAGNYNSTFTPAAGSVYGVVHSGGGTATLRNAAVAGATVANLPDGAFLSVPSAALPLTDGTVSVSAMVNGEQMTGYLDSKYILVWPAQ
ncbi:MAG: hypothetical protein IKQ91_01585 [Oscillospiraceae bacterium]|nr:hypothetical protein [Oscillospiraceae bacterium]